MIKELGMLLVGLFCLVTNPASAKKFSITYDGSCEAASFRVDKDFLVQGESNIWSYTGKGTELCANFYGIGSKVKAKYFGINSEWLLFSVQSTAPGLAGWQYMIAIQYPIASGKLYIQNVVDGGSLHDGLVGTYTVNSAP